MAGGTGTRQIASGNAVFTSGEIMVARRENFHRIYDVRERVRPPRCTRRSAVARCS